MSKLKEIRAKRGLTQPEAAKGIGIAPAMLSMMENGQRRGSDNVKSKVANFYNVPVGQLFFSESVTKRD